MKPFAVFARKKHAEPLTYIGSVQAENTERVAAAALTKYGPEDTWLEMVVVPQEDMITVFAEYGEEDE